MPDDCEHEWIETEEWGLPAIECVKCRCTRYLTLADLKILSDAETRCRKRIRELEAQVEFCTTTLEDAAANHIAVLVKCNQLQSELEAKCQ